MTSLPDGHPVDKHCPECHYRSSLVIDTDEDTQNQVLRCLNCDYTEPIPESVLMRLTGQTKLI